MQDNLFVNYTYLVVYSGKLFLSARKKFLSLARTNKPIMGKWDNFVMYNPLTAQVGFNDV